MTTITLRIDAAKYADEDDCLAAAAADVAQERGLEGWQLDARWENNQRDVILIDVPA